jgi:WXG100 family type VII secretion target
MSDYEIKLNYAMAEEMAQTFKQGTEQLQDTMLEMQSLANLLEGGALKGRGGTAFVEAIRNKLSPALTRLTEKFQELEGDVKAAIEAMREADSQAESGFNN